MQLIKGMDVSMLKELEERGASYYLYGEKKDIFHIFKEVGVNLIRLRLWHDPYSETGEAYGGGTNDAYPSTSSSSSVISSPNRSSAVLMGAGLLMSTPAIFSRLMGSVEQPPERKFR